jgi:hypothetical protein
VNSKYVVFSRRDETICVPLKTVDVCKPYVSLSPRWISHNRDLQCIQTNCVEVTFD